MLSEMNHRKTNLLGFHLYVESKTQNKTEPDSQRQEASCWLPEGADDTGEGIKRYKLRVIK